jgi:capsular polysaccharide transport system permease protein
MGKFVTAQKENPQNPAAGSPKAQKPPNPTRPTAKPASMQRRHWVLLMSFVVVVLVPVAFWANYVYTRAADQFVSTVGFTVRTEEVSSPLDLLGGLGSLSGSSSTDTDILYQFIQSQKMVETIDSELDLRGLFSKPENDPVYAFDASGSIEDLIDYWQKMVRVNYDNSTALIELQVRAFEPEDAQNVAAAIFDESSRMINALSAIAREDTTRYAREELDKSIERLKISREAMTQFRLQNQIADPTTEITVQTGLMNALQQRLSDALIELDLLADVASNSDPRIGQSQRKIEVIQQRIEDERRKYGLGGRGGGTEDFSTLIGEYESLFVDREFAEKSYVAALHSFDLAVAEARRQSRYLAAYVRPTLAETALYPKRIFAIFLAGLLFFVIWSVGTLVYYSVRDRR